MKRLSNKFEDRLGKLEDITGAHRELSGRFPLLTHVKPPSYEGSVIKKLSEEGRGFLRRRSSRLRNKRPPL